MDSLAGASEKTIEQVSDTAQAGSTHQAGLSSQVGSAQQANSDAVTSEAALQEQHDGSEQPAGQQGAEQPMPEGQQAEQPMQVEKQPSMLAEFFEETLMKKDGTEGKASEVLKEKIIAFYFSACWSPPCKDFTPLLAEFHREINKKGAPFEVVFVSCDTSTEDMFTYFSSMHGDWWALPYTSKFITELRDLYEISMVPKLVVTRSDGSAITSKGRKEVTDKRLTAFLAWYDQSDVKVFSPSNFNLFQTGIIEDEDRKARALLREMEDPAH